MYDSLIFDMDGTLVNFVKQITKSWNHTCKIHGFNKSFNSQQITSIMGLTAKEIGQLLFDGDETKVDICCQEEVSYLASHMGKTYIPNKKFLNKLASKYDLFIVSNCLEGYIEVFLKHFHFEKYFKDYLNSTTGLSKGENIKQLVNKYHLKKIIYIGDTIKDYQASQEADVDFIWASYGFGSVNNTKKINNLKELLDL